MIAGWLERWPTMNIGLRCDHLSVFDVDGDQGEESLGQLEYELGPLPPTRSQTTGRGRHRLFLAEGVGNSTRALGSPPGLHLRGGANGYIVVAPSRHAASGRRYAWTDDRPPAELPAGWLERLTTKHPCVRPRTSAPAPAPRAVAATNSSYGRAALRSELERLLRAPEGDRNEQLNRSVFRLGQLVAGGELPRGQVERDATTIALLIGLTPEETEATIESALKAGLAGPRRRSRRRDRGTP
jgi:hypothetical protein